MFNRNEMNLLRSEKSPYLLQHKNNPVNWYPWGPDAFKKAQEKNQLIFLSIGYSSCHWCHVMERESFEDQEVADFLNRFFISIKVDREELPAVDSYYMDAIHALGLRGGWPLSLFLLPTGEPIWGGTYFPKPHFMNVLREINIHWQNGGEQLRQQGQALVRWAKQSLLQNEVELEKKEDESELIWDDCIDQFHSVYDVTHGGFSFAPKFPQFTQLQFLMRLIWTFPEKKVTLLPMLDHTLQSMYRGGLYDHIGGGFYRYSTDSMWLIPHFEKMVYDNALAVICYLEAYQLTHNPLYRFIAEETLSYLSREMRGREGGFGTAEDADSEGVEGKFYLWDYEELRSQFDDEEWKIFTDNYSVSPEGDFEGLTHLNRLKNDQLLNGFSRELIGLKQKLYLKREQRVHPFKDEKVLTSWNGLIIKAYALAVQVLEDKSYLHIAEECALFIQKNLVDESGLLRRRWMDGEAKHDSILEDYSYLIDGLLTLYQSSFNANWLQWAFELQQKQDSLFWSVEKRCYISYRSPLSSLCEGMKWTDEAIPNSLATASLNLYRLNLYIPQSKWDERLETLLLKWKKEVLSYPLQYCAGLNFLLQASRESVDFLKVEGDYQSDELTRLRQFLSKQFLPFLTLHYVADHTATLRFVLCQKECWPPILKVIELIPLLTKK